MDIGTAASSNQALYPPARPAPATSTPGTKLKSLAKLVLHFALGGLGGFLIAYAGSSFIAGLGNMNTIALIAAWFLSIWPHILIHEFGHVLAGLGRGQRLVALGVGPLRVQRTDRRWTFKRAGGIRGIGGYAAMVPAAGRDERPADLTIVLLGGPVANLVTAAIAIALTTLLTSAPIAAGVLAGIGLSALFIGLMNLLPFTTQGWRSDGRGLLDLWRGAPDAALQRQMAQVTGLHYSGIRPRDWPEASLPTPGEGDPKPSLLALNAHAFWLSWAIDRRDPATAFEHAKPLAAHFWSFPAPMQGPMAATLASHGVMLADDIALARTWREHCTSSVLLDMTPYQSWLDAELALHDGDAEQAQIFAIEARSRLDDLPDAVSRMMLEESLDEMDAKLATLIADAAVQSSATASSDTLHSRVRAGRRLSDQSCLESSDPSPG